jgi:CHASE1-domain containing sensor protein
MAGFKVITEATARPSATELAREQAQIRPAQEHDLAHPPTQKIEPPMSRNEVALGHDIGMGL